MRAKFFTYLLLSLLLSTCVTASEIEKLYEARVLVPANTENEQNEHKARQLLVKKAFTKVIHKVSGSKAFLKSTHIDKIMAQAESLVHKFAFQSEKPLAPLSVLSNADTINKNPTTEIKVLTKPDKEPNKTWFWARFSKRGVNQLLKKYHLAIWGNIRPDSLIWLSIEKNHKRKIVSPSSNSSLVNLLNDSAKQRAIKLIFPFGDLQDSEKLSSADLWGNYSQVIKSASLRYNPQAILVIRVHQEPSGLWIAKWSLYVLDKVDNWSSRNENLIILLNQGIDSLANKLAALFALKSDSINKNSRIIQINNVTNFNSFLSLGRYFKQVSIIQSINLVQVQGDSLSFKVYYIGDENQLTQNLILGDILQKVENTASPENNINSNKSSEYVSIILDKPKPNKIPELQTTEGKQKKSTYIQPDLEFWLAK